MEIFLRFCACARILRIHVYLTLFFVIKFSCFVYYSYLPMATAANCKVWTSGDVASGLAKCDPQSIWNPRKNCRSFVDATSTESGQHFNLVLVPYRFSTDSKTRDLEWPFCVKFCFARYVWSSEDWLSTLC